MLEAGEVFVCLRITDLTWSCTPLSLPACLHCASFTVLEILRRRKLEEKLEKPHETFSVRWS